MRIELLAHHLSPVRQTDEFGVFDAWEEIGLSPTMKDVQQRVIPRLKRLIGRDGIPIYPFLRNNPGERHEFIKRWLECYRVYIEGDFEEIPDFDPKTGKHNQDYLCLKCPNWDQLCSSKRINRS